MQNFFGRSTGFAFGLEGMQHSTGTSRSGIQWQSHRLWLYSFCCHALWDEREGDPVSVTSQVRMLFFLRFRVNISGNWLLYLSLATLHTFQSIRESGTWWRRWLLFGYGDCLARRCVALSSDASVLAVFIARREVGEWRNSVLKERSIAVLLNWRNIVLSYTETSFY